jgi:FAD/FMN-containing dehydrogenase/Fe-S oxidoreductase
MAGITADKVNELRKRLEGDVFDDHSSLLQYATDASAYRQVPLLVTRPMHAKDLRELVLFAGENKLPLIPRTAGTSLAGQVVGEGIIADVSKYMNRILEINAEEGWVRVEPGVVLDELNRELAGHGLFFGPETSTSSRCMIGGMVGNNACGAHSLIYGSTRDHTLSVDAILSDGSEAEFGLTQMAAFDEKCRLGNLEGKLYRNIRDILSDPLNQASIRAEYPHPAIKRRNTGYAIDLLLNSEPFTPGGAPFNFSGLIAGSEGTLALITGIKLNLVPLPPAEKALVCVHCSSLQEAFNGNLVALKYKPGAVELMDGQMLELTKDNRTQRKNRFFIEGDPAAILIIEFARDSREEILRLAGDMESEMRKEGFGYYFPLLEGDDMAKVWSLRKAGLGVLSNMPGDAKPVAVIEDTAVRPEDLPAYMSEIEALLKKYGLACVYHAHIGTGELHIRPVLNLKDEKDVGLFHTIAEEVARLIKKYKGSLSGEHGDGRLRGAFIPYMIGERNYGLLLKIKQAWDPENILNPGKITATPPMNTHLRYIPGRETKMPPTLFSFAREGGILRAVEKCNGSGDCRKTHLIGGTMCPSYMATGDEDKTTRARANILREFLTHSEKENPFDHEEIYRVMDLCLSCKACKSECPSNVDITKYKAEFLQHYYDERGIPLRTRAIARIGHLNRLGAIFPGIFNAIAGNAFTAGILKKILGFAPQRNIPRLHRTTLRRWLKRHPLPAGTEGRKIFVFADEFTNYNDAETGITAIKLLRKLGYDPLIPVHRFSGRTFLSKGLVRKAARLAKQNVMLLEGIVTEENPLIGIEPSAILTFRDEYPDLLSGEAGEKASALAPHCYTIEEFISGEFNEGRISRKMFTEDAAMIKFHGHCYQKAVGSVESSLNMLGIPKNYVVEEIKSGCCGMAGSFGYEKEHYELSMKVGELVLFPAVRKAGEALIISAPGTSCRQQIMDGTGRSALHPVEVLYRALKDQ